MSALFQDLRYAVRVLFKSRGFALAAIGVLALGIGANSAIFSVVNAVLLRPMPFPDADRLVKLYHVPPAKTFPGVSQFAVSPANYLDWRDQAQSFEGMAAYTNRQSAVTGFERPEIVRTCFIGGDFFSIVRMGAQIGRVFTPADDQPGRERVAVISDGFWKSHFASSPTAIGRKLILNGEPFTIIGVASASLLYTPWRSTDADVWAPLAWNSELRAERKNHNFLVVARMKPGVPVERAQAEMNTISDRLAAQYPDANRDWGASVIAMRDDLIGDIKPMLLILLGAVAFVLLIACANVANLITARNLARRKEMAVRAALGASRRRALQQLLCEAILLSLAGGLVGILAAKFTLPLLAEFVRQQVTIAEIPLDAPVILYTLAISLLTGLIAGAFPAWRSSRTELNDALKQSAGRAASDSAAGRTRGVLVAAEVALSLMLLTGAGLMIRSLWLLSGVDPGFNPNNVLTMLSIAPSSATKPEQSRAHFSQVLEHVRALPGVESAALVDNLPLTGGSAQPFTIPGQPEALFAQQPTVAVRVISTDYLRTLRIALLRGRDLAESDTPDRQRVVLISDSMAKRFWPNQDPIGQHLTLSFSPEKVCEVVGVVADIKQNGLDSREPRATLYEDAGQRVGTGMTLAIRTAGRPEAMIGTVTNVLQEIAPDQPVRNPGTLETIVNNSIANRRTSMFMLSAFAALALLLAGFGLYSVLAYSVRRRVREIGIRMALGASVPDVLKMVTLESMRPTVAGMVVGLGASLALSSVLTKLVFGIRPTDPLTFVAVAIVLAIVAAFASVIPAWRATRIDPIQVLRDE
jgi:predicted permease